MLNTKLEGETHEQHRFIRSDQPYYTQLLVGIVYHIGHDTYYLINQVTTINSVYSHAITL